MGADSTAISDGKVQITPILRREDLSSSADLRGVTMKLHVFFFLVSCCSVLIALGAPHAPARKTAAGEELWLTPTHHLGSATTRAERVQRSPFRHRGRHHGRGGGGGHHGHFGGNNNNNNNNNLAHTALTAGAIGFGAGFLANG